MITKGLVIAASAAFLLASTTSFATAQSADNAAAGKNAIYAKNTCKSQCNKCKGKCDKCKGQNKCKGHNKCKGYNKCKGQNKCKSKS